MLWSMSTYDLNSDRRSSLTAFHWCTAIFEKASSVVIDVINTLLLTGRAIHTHTLLGFGHPKTPSAAELMMV